MSPFVPLAVEQHLGQELTPSSPKMPRHCPNDPSHKRFIATVQITQEWIVDEDGEYIETNCEVTDDETDPDDDDEWTCATCGALADSEEDLLEEDPL